MYQQVDSGLINPTWEPEEEMRSQIAGLTEDDLVCWYGRHDGSVSAVVNPTPNRHDFYTFKKVDDSWVLMESGESLTIH